MTLRDALGLCEAFHEFEELAGMRLSETELEAYKEQADAMGVSLGGFFEKAVTRIRRAQEKLAAQHKGKLH